MSDADSSGISAFKYHLYHLNCVVMIFESEVVICVPASKLSFPAVCVCFCALFVKSTRKGVN